MQLFEVQTIAPAEKNALRMFDIYTRRSVERQTCQAARLAGADPRTGEAAFVKRIPRRPSPFAMPSRTVLVNRINRRGLNRDPVLNQYS